MFTEFLKEKVFSPSSSKPFQKPLSAVCLFVIHLHSEAICSFPHTHMLYTLQDKHNAESNGVIWLFFVETAGAGAAPSLPLPGSSLPHSLRFTGKQHAPASNHRAWEDQHPILHSNTRRAESTYMDSGRSQHFAHSPGLRSSNAYLQEEDPSALHARCAHCILQQSYGPALQNGLQSGTLPNRSSQRI